MFIRYGTFIHNANFTFLNTNTNANTNINTIA
jgi:hypothetical protein